MLIYEIFNQYFLHEMILFFRNPASRFAPDEIGLTLRNLGYVLAMYAFAAIIQLIFLKACKRTALKLIPLWVCIFLMLLSEILFHAMEGWNKLLGHFLCFVAMHWFFGAVVVVVVWLIVRYVRKNKTEKRLAANLCKENEN